MSFAKMTRCIQTRAVVVAVAMAVGGGAAHVAAEETIVDQGSSGGGSSIFDDNRGKPSTSGKPTTTAPAKPVAVPTKAQQAAALELVKQVYAAGLAKKAPADRAAVARQMLLQAQRSKDPAEKYVLLV